MYPKPALPPKFHAPRVLSVASLNLPPARHAQQANAARDGIRSFRLELTMTMEDHILDHPRAMVLGEAAALARSSSVLLGYECIDIANDLESCGGCVDRSLDLNSTSGDGRDCSAIPNVDTFPTENHSALMPKRKALHHASPLVPATTLPRLVPQQRIRVPLACTVEARARRLVLLALRDISVQVAHLRTLKFALLAVSLPAAMSSGARHARLGPSTTSMVPLAAARVALVFTMFVNSQPGNTNCQACSNHTPFSNPGSPSCSAKKGSYAPSSSCNQASPSSCPASQPFPSSVARRAIRPPRCLKPGQKACALYSAAVGRSRSVLKGFECVSVDSDLWSCGGCVDRSLAGKQSQAGGRDCSAIPDVDTVECESGKCVIRSSQLNFTEPRVSERFNAQDAEIVFQSADDVKFYIHRQNLVACTEGFSPPDPATFDDVVHLSESSSTLELLFRFIYPEPQPDLEEIDFSVLIMLAEAAEKYQVYSAVNICSIHLTKRLPEQSEEILVHALKHSNRKIVARAAPLLLGRSLEDVLLKVPQPYQILWIRYHAQWSRVWAHSISCAPNAQELARDVCRQCGKLRHEYVIEAMSKLSTSIDMLRALDSVFSSSTMCSSCCGELSVMKSWRKSLEAEIKRIPSTNDLFFPGDDPSKGKKTEPDSPEVVHADGETPTRRISLGSGADIIFQSADGVLFELHQQNIKACAANLLPPEYDSLAPIQIPHASSTLRLLFRFLYPFPHPDLELTDFLTLELLSAAAEQYKIYPAIRVIDIRLSDALPLNLVQHTSTVMKHALRTNNRKLMDTSAPLLIEKPISDTAKLMASDVIIHWVCGASIQSLKLTVA
ncbi:hypothetical protein D9615_006292 [Tricholomella constricta]|uniref:Protein CPL1-like domain-containing protein n=1 Tax=Tricholomella constricta TaxID=117010 RepID=A0A8H5HB76_9AGAR|nr:hypothetical protein D9615_006292 [Tricholomella constricta]